MGSITAHSGTVGAAIMATHLGVPSIAVSNFYSIITERATRVPEARYNDCAEFVVMVVASIEANMATVKALAAPMLVNINWPGLPKADIKGVKFTQLGNLGARARARSAAAGRAYKV